MLSTLDSQHSPDKIIFSGGAYLNCIAHTVPTNVQSDIVKNIKFNLMVDCDLKLDRGQRAVTCNV